MEIKNETFEKIQQLVRDLPNDSELGAEIRRLVLNTPTYLDTLKVEKDERDKKQIEEANEKVRIYLEKKNFKSIDNKEFRLVDKDEVKDPRFALYYDIANAFYLLIESNLENIGASTNTLQKSKFIKWITPIRLMMESDGVTNTQLLEVFKFLKGHNFWSANIQSSDKLRKQFSILHAQAKSQILKTETNGKQKQRNKIGGSILEQHLRNLQST
jgi:hypothetical protein